MNDSEVMNMNDTQNTKNTRIWLKADRGRLSKVVEFGTGKKVEIPINRDGSVRWLDDNKLIKKTTN